MNTIYKQICLTLICIGLLATTFAVTPAASQPTRGPVIDTLRNKVTRSPAAQRLEMTAGPPTGSDFWTGLIRPSDIEAMQDQGKGIYSRSGFHMCFIGFNMRNHPLDDVNFRHALALLYPKSSIIGTLFKYVNVEINTPCPPALSLWYNSKVDPHSYSPERAEDVLAAAGYQKISGVWMDKDGSALPSLRFFCPTEITAPTSYTACRRLAEEAQAIGLNNIVITPMDFSTYVNMVFQDRNFDIFWVCYGLTRFPTHMYYMFHSINDFPGGDNCYGINYPQLDALLDVLWTSLDHPAKVAAVQEAQELVMGGSTTNPMPDYIPPTDPRSQALPLIPIYSRNYYDILSPSLVDAVNMFGYATDNSWSYLTMHWNTANQYRPGTTEKTIVRVEDEYPERLNPLFATTVYAVDFMGQTEDGLINVNPYTHADEPWLATNWEYHAVSGGMDVTFDLRLTDSQGATVKWQDGNAVTVNDVKFAWDFLNSWQIPNYWAAFQFYDSANTVIVDANTIRARMTTTSQWLLYNLAGVAYMLPQPVWAKNPDTGLDWTGVQQILSFDPSAHAGPGGLPTMLYGTGPFIMQHSTIFIGTNGYGDLNANRNYWVTQDDAAAMLRNMFHKAGDVDYSGLVDSTDLAAIGLAYLTHPGDPLWNANADVTGEAGTPPDNSVDIYDLSTAGKFFRQTKVVP